MPFNSVKRRKDAMAWYRKKGMKSTQRKFGVSATQMKKYLEQEDALNETLEKAKVADNIDSKKRKRKCEAKSRQAQKKLRVGKAGICL